MLDSMRKSYYDEYSNLIDFANKLAKNSTLYSSVNRR